MINYWLHIKHTCFCCQRQCFLDNAHHNICPLQHVLVLSALDVDALCACKILQSLFKADNVEHTLIPVAGKADLQRAFADHADQVRTHFNIYMYM